MQPATTALPSPTDPRDRRYACLCAGIVLVAIGAAWPIAECGVNDDWSYTKTALDLATTGHLIYNGWASAMLGAQAYWGALVVKLFGFSFLAVRLSAAPLAAACGAMLYVLHRRAELPPGLALFGALVVILSPVFLVTAPTFMTDLPGLLLLLLSVYGYVRFDEEMRAGDGRIWRWALLGLGAGILGGTVRQVVWFVPMLASALLLLRYARRRRLGWPVAALLAGSAAIAFAAMAGLEVWYEGRPYAIYEAVSPRLITGRADGWMAIRYVAFDMLHTLGAMLLPACAALPLMLRHRLGTGSRGWLRLGAVLLLGLFIWVVLSRYGVQRWVFPWSGMAYSACPYLYSVALAPYETVPTTMPLAAWNAVSVLASLVVAFLLALVIALRFWPGPERRERRETPIVVQLLGLFTALYAATIIIHGIMPNSNGVNDRYLLPILPLATMLLLRALRAWTGRDRAPWPCWVLAGVAAFYGIGSIHDYFAQLRARLVITGELEARGIQRTRIMGGSEYDAWTQITVWGYYNDPRIRVPKGSYVPRGSWPGFRTIYRFYSFTPAISPDYVVALAPHADLTTSDLPPAEYRCWQPPFRRRLILQVRDPGLAHLGAPPSGPAPRSGAP